ncbi:MAG: acyl-CoA carboxylase subunit beta [Bacteroidia bacterium]|nr:acyl-CoA carboxylase subunit beta [Bacteroidia bacterium]
MDIEFNRNEDSYKLLLDHIRRIEDELKKGGGATARAKHKEKGKMLARERIDYLKDKEAEFFEIGIFAGHEKYEEYGGCPAGGVVGGITHVSGRQCLVVANDATVKAGAWFPITVKKNLRFQEIAMENRLPIIYLVDSAGVFLPMQDEIFADKEHFGRVFRNNAKLSSMGITQIAAVMGSCVAGGAYLPIMSDEALIVDKTGSIFLAGGFLVKAAIGETIDNQSLGGSIVQTEISGVIDDHFPDDKSCLDRIKHIIDKLGHFEKAGFDRVKPQNPLKDAKDIYGIIPENKAKPYKMLEIIERIVDKSEFEQYKKDYGKTILCGYARIDGWAVGIVANNREVVKTRKGEMQFGGAIYSDSADKAARFIMNCNQKKIPLVFLQDVTGFMVGSRSEHGGIIKDGAKMVNAVGNSTVPKFTIVVGNSYGAGNYAMCGKAYDPRLILAWPTAKIAVMGGEQAANTILQLEMSRVGTLPLEDGQMLIDKVIQKYNQKTTAIHAASNLWVDAIIDPANTRNWLSLGLNAANNAPIGKFCVGVIQT